MKSRGVEIHLEQQIPPLPPLPGFEPDPNTSEENCDADPSYEYDAGEALLLFMLEV
jgi:hypothetical protein